MAWPPVFGNFSVHTYTDACKCTWRKGKKTGMICPVNHDSYIRTKHLEATHLSSSAQHLRTLSPTSSGQHKHCKRVCNESVWKKSLKVLRKQSCVTTAAGFPVWHSANWAIPPWPRKIVEAIKCGTHRNSSTELSNKKIKILTSTFRWNSRLWGWVTPWQNESGPQTLKEWKQNFNQISAFLSSQHSETIVFLTL